MSFLGSIYIRYIIIMCYIMQRLGPFMMQKEYYHSDKNIVHMMK
jgi:hypothetical protein